MSDKVEQCWVLAMLVADCSHRDGNVRLLVCLSVELLDGLLIKFRDPLTSHSTIRFAFVDGVKCSNNH